MHAESNSPADRTAPGRSANTEAAAADWFARRDAGFTSGEEAAFQRWLAADARHAAAFAQLESAWIVFGKPQRTGAAGDVLAELARRTERRQKRRRAGAVIAVLLALFAGTASWRMSRAPADVTRPSSVATILAPARQELPDGSLVILKTGAKVIEAFSATARGVTLACGEAMFQVRKDPTRPFVVFANGVEVRAVGTAFSVQLGSGQVEVLITEGVVAVEPSKGEPHEATRAAAASPDPLRVLVEAGHRVVIASSDGGVGSPLVTPIATPEIEDRLAWRSPRVEFSGTPLGEAVALLNQAASGGALKLVVAEPALEGMRVSGIFRTDNIEGFVLLLESGFGIKAERSADAVRLMRAPGAAP